MPSAPANTHHLGQEEQSTDVDLLKTPPTRHAKSPSVTQIQQTLNAPIDPATALKSVEADEGTLHPNYGVGRTNV